MSIVDTQAILAFLDVVGRRQTKPERLLLLGGGALLLLGNARATLDIDYVGDDLHRTDFQQMLDDVAAEMHLQVDPVPIERFVPLPPDTETRQRRIGQFGSVDLDRLALEGERIIGRAREFDLDPAAIRRHLAVVRQRAASA